MQMQQVGFHSLDEVVGHHWLPEGIMAEGHLCLMNAPLMYPDLISTGYDQHMSGCRQASLEEVAGEVQVQRAALKT